MSAVLGFEFYQGPEVRPPEAVDFTRPGVTNRRWAWKVALEEAAEEHDAWAVLVTKPNGDVRLFDIHSDRLWEATSWGGTAHLFLAKESKSRLPEAARA